MYYKPPTKKWTPYELYCEFPHARSAATKRMKELRREVFAYQDIQRARTGDEFMDNAVDLVFINEPIDQRIKQLNFLKKYTLFFKKSAEAPQFNDRIARAKQVPITTLIDVRRDGFTKCVFHNEKSASMKVYTNNTFYCFGCNKGGDVIDLLRGIQQCTFTEAVSKLTL